MLTRAKKAFRTFPMFSRTAREVDRRTLEKPEKLSSLCVCMVHSNLLPHTLESQKGDTNRFITIQKSFVILLIFLKMLC